MIRNIYAVYDRKAEDIVGGLHLYAHDAVAVRMFTDAYQMEGTIVRAHPADFKLVCLGYMKGLELTTELRVILDGQTLAATQEGK